MSEGEDIIIKGGSIELEFEDSVYPRNPSNPKKHQNPNRKISRIVVVDENGGQKYDSGESPNGMKWTITISTR
ncbi:MAG TPA: hypothetical protein VGW76_18410 [Pyrinomonadaceae bacterium]|nr:hypothetical protein [Pyrinomonadaceae bacterium]